ncbi:MAG TPA: hypothetical protein VEB23_10170, partial [Ramlibacter sp.]|nr:hypothetical protein [Ramlibacter sp.]
LDAGELDAALAAIEDVVEDVICEPLNTAEIFCDAFLDAACQRAGAAVLADIARYTGGPMKVLLTGISGRTDLASLAHLFGALPRVSFEVAPRGTRVARLRWLQQRLRALRPGDVWLFNHHQDSVAVAAVQPGQGYRLKYLHHGDHHLCLGVTLSWGEHHDPHPMGFRNCREALGRPDNKYLPMALDVPGPAAEVAEARQGPLLTCTAAGRNKIEHAYWPSYAEVIADVLAATGGEHVHIGRLSLPYRWRIRRALLRRGVPLARWRYVPYVRSVAATLMTEQVDLYIGSFPYPGARTLVEAMAAGVAIAAHDHSQHAFLAAMDMLPPGSCFWSRPEELLAFLASHDRAALQGVGRQARAHYEAYHTPRAMRDALAGDPRAQEVPPTALRHRTDPLAQALRRAGEVTLAGVARRRILREARRLRSAFF